MKNNPVISIILPVYNGGRFLSLALKSVLQQTFTDFECILVNDGSTDDSEAIIQTFTDSRIIYVKNEKNSGLIFSLNRGIEMARGKYIARMDADDICLPQRLEKQYEYLELHPETAVVATSIIFINNEGEHTGQWELDKKTITYSSIKNEMPRSNCIAHPGVMIRTDIIRKLRYKSYQRNIEDYDLWLRMLNRGYKIEKMETPLLLYRIHETSITGSILKKKNFFFKHASMKRKFIFNEIGAGKCSFFMLRVFLYQLLDYIKGTGKFIKQLLVR